MNVYDTNRVQFSGRLPTDDDALDDTRIVGGERADIRQWPWIAKLDVGCGASILNDKWLLTAAHCCAASPKNVITGAQKSGYELSGDSNEKIYTIKRFIIHPQYEVPGYAYGYDFCLVETNDSIQIDRTFTDSIDLPTKSPSLSEQCAVAGYGTTAFGGPLSESLMKTNLNLMTDHICSEYISGFHPESEFCAGYLAGGKDSCQGDSGGPLVCNDSQNRPILTGVVSWGNNCGLAFQPGVYGKVSIVREWINDTMNEIITSDSNDTQSDSYLVQTNSTRDCWFSDDFKPQCDFELRRSRPNTAMECLEMCRHSEKCDRALWYQREQFWKLDDKPICLLYPIGTKTCHGFKHIDAINQFPGSKMIQCSPIKCDPDVVNSCGSKNAFCNRDDEDTDVAEFTCKTCEDIWQPEDCLEGSCLLNCFNISTDIDTYTNTKPEKDEFTYVKTPWADVFFKHYGKKMKTFDEATQICQNDGAHLPIPLNSEENQFYIEMGIQNSFKTNLPGRKETFKYLR